jgi:agmatinase
VVGLPWDSTSSFRRGASEGPDVIRQATSGRLYNRFTERGIDLSTVWKVCDHGNVKQTSSVFRLEKWLAQTTGLHDHKNPFMLFLGGDHFITFPCFTLTAKKRKRRLALLYFDAHPDLYPRYEGASFSHATVVSRILDGVDTSTGVVCYVGTRAITRDQDARIKELGLTTYSTRDVNARGSREISASIRSLLSDESVYLSIDLDCLDPAFAPGVANPQPGGLTTRQLLDILNELDGLDVLAADVVEYAPRFDSRARTTAFTSAIIIKELMGLMARSDTALRHK